jgi:peptide/nickel transport system ATP-binding protein
MLTQEANASVGKSVVAAAPVLRVESLGVSFVGKTGPRVRAVDSASFTVYPGQTLAIVGESGCGKSVTAMSVLRLVPSPPSQVDRGRILFSPREGEAARDLLKLSDGQIRQVRGGEIAMIFQEPMTSLNPVYTIGDQIVEAVMLHQGLSRRAAEKAAVDAMRDVGIHNPEGRLHAYPHQFSGGMRQRVMIAMAIACRPALLLADEPTTALDVTIQAQILELLRALQRSRGMGMVLITHDLGVVANHADVVCVMYAGRVVEYGRTNDVIARPLHPYTRGLLACVPALSDQPRTERKRLVTIKELAEAPGQFDAIGGVHRAWWPWHDAPTGTMRDEGNAASDSVLVEVEPEHFVCMWRSATADAVAVAVPDLRPTNAGV